jgi:hypothetical protein
MSECTDITHTQYMRRPLKERTCPECGRELGLGKQNARYFYQKYNGGLQRFQGKKGKGPEAGPALDTHEGREGAD